MRIISPLVKAKFHYTSWFGASSELASVMEFGFKPAKREFRTGKLLVIKKWRGTATTLIYNFIHHF